MVLALLVLEAVRNSISYEGPSTFYIPDAYLVELHPENRRSWNVMATPAGQIHRHILNALQAVQLPSSRCQAQDYKRLRLEPKGVGDLAGPSSSQHAEPGGISSIFHVNDRVVQHAFETMGALRRPADYLYWVHDNNTSITTPVSGCGCWGTML